MKKKLVSEDAFFYSRDRVQIFQKLITTVGREWWQALSDKEGPSST